MIPKKWVIAFIDDLSRLITFYKVFDSPTTENTITVLTQELPEYGTHREILNRTWYPVRFGRGP